MKNQIKLYRCSKCKEEYKTRLRFWPDNWCRNCQESTETEMYKREKKTIYSDFKVVDWFSTNASACLVLEDHEGTRYNIYLSDVFKYLEGTQIKDLRLQEVKKGEAYGWKVVE